MKEAQAKGIAESDPSFDVGGWDAAQKLAILSTLIFGHRVEVAQIRRESTRPITKRDIDYARDFGYVIKPLAIARRVDAEYIDLVVSPFLVPGHDALSSIDYEMNAVSLYFEGAKNPQTLIGEGAGRKPTARSVVKDIVAVVKSTPESRASTYNLFTCAPRDFSGSSGYSTSSSYLRLNVDDRPGVLAEVTRILGSRGINIQTFEQKEEHKENGAIPVAMLLGSTIEKNIASAMAELNGLSSVHEMLRIRRK